MAKTTSFPKNHNFQDIPSSLRAYLNQLEMALDSSAQYTKKLEVRVSQLERKVITLSKGAGVKV